MRVIGNLLLSAENQFRNKEEMMELENHMWPPHCRLLSVEAVVDIL